MTKDDWYKNKTWNGKIDSNFEDHLKHSRGAVNKANFLQIQGCILLDSTYKNIQEVGVALLSRLFEDFPLEHSSVIVAQEKLGDFYLRQNNFERAEYYFRMVNNYCNVQRSRSGTSAMADLKLAEAIVRSNQPDKLEETYQLVINYPVAGLKLNHHKFYYAELAAHVCDAINKKKEAMAFAKSAIALLNLVKPPLKGHKTYKIGNPSDGQFRTLIEIAEG
jgi:hypothetical protein